MDFLGVIAIFILIVAILCLVYYFILSNSGDFKGFNLNVPNTLPKSVNFGFDGGSGENFASKVKGKINEYDVSSFSTDAFSKKIDAFLDEKSDQLIEEWSLATKNDLSALEKKWVSTNRSIEDLEKRVDEFSDYTNERLDSLDERIQAIEDDKKN
ncbi:hypothetical protein [uncultured Methanobrevibacter sp.]|uniref:hypothetical protein n=1 Tax=uncultured Methanobrevibacter sp. TaxID=253161 RepID=UPI0025F2B559|nr:hypothetical protein [uncultured Methanobrevibacter sp.]